MHESKVIGILATPTALKENNSTWPSIKFTFKLSSETMQNPLFFTTQRLRQLIAEKINKVNDAVSHGIVEYRFVGIDPHTKLPKYSEIMTPFGTQSQPFYHTMQHNGFGKALQKIAIEHMFGLIHTDFVVSPWRTVSEHYEHSLIKRGIKLDCTRGFTIRASELIYKTTKPHNPLTIIPIHTLQKYFLPQAQKNRLTKTNLGTKTH